MCIYVSALLYSLLRIIEKIRVEKLSDEIGLNRNKKSDLNFLNNNSKRWKYRTGNYLSIIIITVTIAVSGYSDVLLRLTCPIREKSTSTVHFFNIFLSDTVRLSVSCEFPQLDTFREADIHSVERSITRRGRGIIIIVHSSTIETFNEINFYSVESSTRVLK